MQVGGFETESPPTGREEEPPGMAAAGDEGGGVRSKQDVYDWNTESPLLKSLRVFSLEFYKLIVD